MIRSTLLRASIVLSIALVAPSSLFAQSATSVSSVPSASSVLSASSTASDIAALKAVMRDFTTAYETRNIDGFMKTLTDSDDVALFLPNPFSPMLIEGRAGARGVVATFFDSIPSTAIVRMTTHEDTFQVFGDTAVNYNYTNIYVYVGGISAKFIARTTNIFSKKDGRWGIVHIHGTALPKESTYLTAPSPFK